MPIRRAWLNLAPLPAGNRSNNCHKSILAHNDKSPSRHDLPHTADLPLEVKKMMIIPEIVTQNEPPVRGWNRLIHARGFWYETLAKLILCASLSLLATGISQNPVPDQGPKARKRHDSGNKKNTLNHTVSQLYRVTGWRMWEKVSLVLAAYLANFGVYAGG